MGEQERKVLMSETGNRFPLVASRIFWFFNLNGVGFLVL